MKRSLIIIFLIMGILSGCTQNNPATTGSTSDSTSEPILSECPAPYWAEDMETFLAAWNQFKNNPNDADALMAYAESNTPDRTSMMIPVLLSEDYRLSAIEGYPTNYHYYYVPADHYQNDISYDDQIIVSVSKDGGFTFAGVVDQYDLRPADGAAYHAANNNWYLDNDGTAISTRFPGDIKFSDASRISEYFTFITYSVNDEIDKRLLTPYTVTDTEELLNAWAQAKENTAANNVLASTSSQNSITVPVLQTDDYRLFFAKVFHNKYKYYFVKSDYAGNELPDRAEYISVCVYTADVTFDDAVAQVLTEENWSSEDLPPENGVAYGAVEGYWILDNNGLAIMISLGSNHLDSPDMLSEYLIFETYPADDSLETE